MTQASLTRKPFGIVRVLFGDPRDPRSRVHRIRRQVAQVAKRKDQGDAGTAFVFGAANFAFVKELGIEARLIDEQPLVYGPPSRAPFAGWTAWRHKPLGWQAALQEYEEIVALDWDIFPLVPIDQARLFRRLNAKSFLQANLMQYRRRKAPYRPAMAGTTHPQDIRKIPSAAFVYLRGADGGHAVERMVDIMRSQPRLTEEQAMALYLDQLYGGWKGIDHWWEHHEPFCCRLKRTYEAVSLAGRIPREKEYWFGYR